MPETDKLIFSRMAFYITECTDFNNPRMMRENMDSCPLSELDAYRSLNSVRSMFLRIASS